jgi:hypothetical protein
MHPPGRGEPVPFGAQPFDDLPNRIPAHSVGCVPINPGRHRAVVGVDTSVGHQKQLFVEQLPIQPFQGTATPSPVAQDIEHRVGVLHYAYLHRLDRCLHHLCPFALQAVFPLSLAGRDSG